MQNMGNGICKTGRLRRARGRAEFQAGSTR